MTIRIEDIIKTRSGFERDDGSARYIYDGAGKYVGQYQPDMLSEDPASGELWLQTYPGDPCYHELSDVEMRSAS